MKQGLAATLAVLGLTALSSGAIAEIVEGRTEQDRRFLVGGVGIEEVEQMRQQAGQFPLQLIVASRTGAYLADTHIRISSPQQGTVLDTTLAAPWLLVDLPPGGYQIEATNRGQTQQRRLTIGAGGRQHLVLQFDVPVDQPAPAAGTDTGLPADLRPDPAGTRPDGTTR
jgi:hypothetical protein